MQFLFQRLSIRACRLDSGDHKPVTKQKLCNGDGGKHVQTQKKNDKVTGDLLSTHTKAVDRLLMGKHNGSTIHTAGAL